MKIRLQNQGLWLSVASLVLIILQTAGIHVIADEYTAIVNSLLTVLVLAGVISNPEASKGFNITTPVVSAPVASTLVATAVALPDVPAVKVVAASAQTVESYSINSNKSGSSIRASSPCGEIII